MRTKRLAVLGAIGAAGAAAGVLAWRAAVRAVIERETRGRLRSTWVDVNGVRVHARVPRARVSPSAVPVVLVHGAVISSTYMIPLAVRLAPEFPVFAPDLPGHGESDRPSHALDVRGLAETLVAWLDAIGLERVALVANSLGCQVVAHVAAEHPERVDRLVLIGPTTEPSARNAGEQLARLASDAVHERQSLVLLESQAIIKAGLRRGYAELRAAVEDRIEDTLRRVSAPTLVVRGSRDPLVSEAWAGEVARAARAPAVIEVPGVGHAVNYSAPDALVRAIRPFLLEGQAAPESRGIAIEMR